MKKTKENRKIKKNKKIMKVLGDFQDTSDFKENGLPPLHDYCKKYLTKKDCVNESQVVRSIKMMNILKKRK